MVSFVCWDNCYKIFSSPQITLVSKGNIKIRNIRTPPHYLNRHKTRHTWGQNVNFYTRLCCDWFESGSELSVCISVCVFYKMPAAVTNIDIGLLTIRINIKHWTLNIHLTDAIQGCMCFVNGVCFWKTNNVLILGGFGSMVNYLL